MVEFDHIIKKEKIDEDDKIEDIVNTNSRFETPLIVEKSILDIAQGEAIQLERRGYFYIDKTGSGTATLHYIPDGKSNPMSIVKKKVDPKTITQGDTKKSKKQEKQEKKPKEGKEGKEGKPGKDREESKDGNSANQANDGNGNGNQGNEANEANEANPKN